MELDADLVDKPELPEDPPGAEEGDSGPTVLVPAAQGKSIAKPKGLAASSSGSALHTTRAGIMFATHWEKSFESAMGALKFQAEQQDKPLGHNRGLALIKYLEGGFECSS